MANTKSKSFATECAEKTNFQFTHVTYNFGDNVGFILAFISLFPVFLLVQLVALLFIRRDWQTFIILIGLSLNVFLNNLLKTTFHQLRPDSSCPHGFDQGSFEEFGMPSNHSQFMAFFASYSTFFIFLRVEAALSERLFYTMLSIVSMCGVSYSRVYHGYHTPEQVLVGCVVGVFTGSLWFLCYAFVFEPIGHRVVNFRIARYFCVRDTSRVTNNTVFEFQSIHGSLHQDCERFLQHLDHKAQSLSHVDVIALKCEINNAFDQALAKIAMTDHEDEQIDKT